MTHPFFRQQGRRPHNRRLLSAWLALGTALLAPTLAFAAPAGEVPGTSSEDEAAQAEALAAKLRAALSAAGSAGAQQIEGSLQLTLANAQVKCSVAQSALAQLRPAGLTGSALAALRQVTASASRCATGPGAGPAGVDFLQQGTTLGLPGGSSNYLGGAR